MIIHLKKSSLFTVDPDERFAREYDVPVGLLRDIWKRYKLIGYTIPEVCEFYEMKTKKHISHKSMMRWMWRTEIYSMTRPAINKGAEVVVSSFFREHEWRVMREITKNLRSSVRGKTKTLL
jgi:hypothetical protein